MAPPGAHEVLRTGEAAVQAGRTKTVVGQESVSFTATCDGCTLFPQLLCLAESEPLVLQNVTSSGNKVTANDTH